MNLKKKKKGFTLIELMAVIAILAILAAILVPSISGYVLKAKVAAVRSDAKSIVNAAEVYNSTVSGTSLLTDNSTADEIENYAKTAGIDIDIDKTKIDGTVKFSVLKQLADGTIDDDSIKTNIQTSGNNSKYK